MRQTFKMITLKFSMRLLNCSEFGTNEMTGYQFEFGTFFLIFCIKNFWTVPYLHLSYFSDLRFYDAHSSFQTLATDINGWKLNLMILKWIAEQNKTKRTIFNGVEWENKRKVNIWWLFLDNSGCLFQCLLLLYLALIFFPFSKTMNREQNIYLYPHAHTRSTLTEKMKHWTHWLEKFIRCSRDMDTKFESLSFSFWANNISLLRLIKQKRAFHFVAQSKALSIWFKTWCSLVLSLLLLLSILLNVYHSWLFFLFSLVSPFFSWFSILLKFCILCWYAWDFVLGCTYR